MKIFGRDPSLLWSAIAVALMIGSSFGLKVFGVELSPEFQAVLNGVVVAAWGVFTALTVEKDKVVPAVTAFVKVLIALAVGFGLQWSAEQQALVMTGVSFLLAFVVRTQVVAPVPQQPGQ